MAPQRLVDWPWLTIEVECSLCRRHGRYRLARLAERYGADIQLWALLTAIVDRCGLDRPDVKPRAYEARCGVRFRVPPGGPLPEGVPAREGRPGETWPPRPRRLGPQGPLPTVGGALADGQRGVLVYCLGRLRDGYRCHHQGRLDLAVLGMPPDLPFIHMPKTRRLRCSRCGSRDVEVRTDWPNPIEEQARRMSGGQPRVQVLNGITMPIGGEGAALPSDAVAPGSIPEHRLTEATQNKVAEERPSQPEIQ